MEVFHINVGECLMKRATVLAFVVLAVCVHRTAAQDPPPRPFKLEKAVTRLVAEMNQGKVSVGTMIEAVEAQNEFGGDQQLFEAINDALAQHAKDLMPGLIKEAAKNGTAIQVIRMAAFTEKAHEMIPIKEMIKLVPTAKGIARKDLADLIVVLSEATDDNFKEAKKTLEELAEDKDVNVPMQMATVMLQHRPEIEKKIAARLRKALENDELKAGLDWQLGLQTVLRYSPKDGYAVIGKVADTEYGNDCVMAMRTYKMEVRDMLMPPIVGIIPRPAQIQPKEEAAWAKDLVARLDKEKSFANKTVLARLILLAQDKDGAGKAADVLFEEMRMAPPLRLMPGMMFGGGGIIGGIMPFGGGQVLDSSLALSEGGDAVKKHVIAGLKHKDSRVRMGCVGAIVDGFWTDHLGTLIEMQDPKNEKSPEMRHIATFAAASMIARTQQGMADFDPMIVQKMAQVWEQAKMEQKSKAMQDRIVKDLKGQKATEEQDRLIAVLGMLDVQVAVREIDNLLKVEMNGQRAQMLHMAKKQLQGIPIDN